MSLDPALARSSHALGADGPFARLLDRFEVRPAQLELARAVEDALAHDRTLICEAGTGTGKTFGYLVPAVQSGLCVVISTATKNLQEQIFHRDLPLVERALGVSARAAMLKGIGNYVCRRRYEEWRRDDAALDPRRARALPLVERFVRESPTGDVSELPALAESDAIWQDIVSGSDTRIGAACAYHDECFVTRLKRSADAARLVVVNHHLFFADLALRGAHPGRLLPDYDAVIFDEAHEIEDVATQFFGRRVSRSRIERLAHEIERRLGRATLRSAAERGLTELRAAAAAFWAELERRGVAGEPRTSLEPGDFDGELRRAWYRLDTALEIAAPETATDEGAQLAARAQRIREALGEIIDGSAGSVTWLDASSQGLALSSSPVAISSILRERLFQKVPALVFTSATLADAAEKPGVSRFAYLQSRLGLEAPFSADELIVSSDFDYASRALLYTPRDLPLPNEPGFLDAVAERSAELIEITAGGAFVLATSLRSMRRLADRLAALLPGTLLLTQGDAPKTALIDEFRRLQDAVLVATMGFWQGVDVPGRALRLVILEKIPFAVPSDPIVRARALALERDGKNPFTELHLPDAALSLKQGFGRLIRSTNDAGVVALLDGRVHRRGYGKRLLGALPPARREHELDGVRRFWAVAGLL